MFIIPLPWFLMWIMVISVTWSPSSTSSSKSSSSSISPSNRSVAQMLASIDQKLGFVLHGQGAVHQLQYAVNHAARRLDTVELRMARLEHKIDTKLDGLTTIALSIVSNLAIIETQIGVQMQKVVNKLDNTETNILTSIDERTEDTVDDVTRLLNEVIANASSLIECCSNDVNNNNINNRTQQDESDAGQRKESTSWELSTLAVNSSEQMAIVGEKRLRDLDSDIEIYTKKVMNTYQEVLKESRLIDVYLRQLLDQGNQTRLTVREAFRKLYQHTKPVSTLDELLKSLAKKVSDMAATVDTSFASLLVAQNTFIATCHRVQQQEPIVETRIYHLLHKLVQEIGNRSKMNNEDCSLRDAFENHRKDVGRALHDLVWTIITVGNQTVEDLRKEYMCTQPEPEQHLELPTLTALETTSPKPTDIDMSNTTSDLEFGETAATLKSTNIDIELTTLENLIESIDQTEIDKNREKPGKNERQTGTDVAPESLPIDDMVDDVHNEDNVGRIRIASKNISMINTNNGSQEYEYNEFYYDNPDDPHQ